MSASGATSATLAYDPLGRLHQIVGGGTTTRLLHDGDELVAEYNASGTMLRRYVLDRFPPEECTNYLGNAVNAAA